MAKAKWKLAAGKTWKQKLTEPHPNHDKVVAIPERMHAKVGKGTMVIASPRKVDAILRKVRKGRLITLSQLRDKLAAEAGADLACPLTTGIFMKIVAEAAEEARHEGKKRLTPYWRVVRDNGQLIATLPGGASAQASNLRAEGFVLKPGSGNGAPRVKGHERYLQ